MNAYDELSPVATVYDAMGERPKAVECGGCAPPVLVPESSAVNVRFSLAEVIRKLERDGDEHGVADSLHEIGAAVAELIDKADNAARVLHNVIAARQIGEGYASILDDLNAALARVQGSRP